MRTARSVARWLHFGAAALFVATVVVQFLLAGFALFGAIGWDMHETVGFGPSHLLSILVFLLAVVAWLRLPDIGLGLLIAALTTVQVFLPNAGSGWVAGLHPVNALVLFMLGQVVMRRNRRGLALRPGAVAFDVGTVEERGARSPRASL